MSKRMRVFVSVLVAVVLLTVGGAAAVLADEDTAPPPEGDRQVLLARVAEILDIPQDDLVNAFEQAQQEMRQEAYIRFLDKAVEEGRITEEEADELKEWWEDRPEGIDHLSPQFSLGKRSLGYRMWGVQRGCQGMRPPQPAD